MKLEKLNEIKNLIKSHGGILNIEDIFWQREGNYLIDLYLRPNEDVENLGLCKQSICSIIPSYLYVEENKVMLNGKIYSSDLKENIGQESDWEFQYLIGADRMLLDDIISHYNKFN